MAKKFYAVKAGRVPGIYSTWTDCQKQINGYSGAVYKSFPTAGEAAVFLGWSSPSSPSRTDSDSMVLSDSTQNGDNIPNAAVSPLQDSTDTKAIAYVDGSYNAKTGKYGYGVVFFHDKTEEHFCGNGCDLEMASMRNVAGEILGARVAMEKALERGCRELIIYHDYEGIARWCLGEWKTNKTGTQEYKAYFDSICSRLKVSFVKVKGHSNDTYNDLADSLAKSTIFV